MEPRAPLILVNALLLLLLCACGARQSKGDAHEAVEDFLQDQQLTHYRIADAIVYEEQAITGSGEQKSVAYYWIYVWHAEGTRKTLKLQVDRSGRVTRDTRPTRR